MKKSAVYPGTFDPITLGHVDIIKRAAKMFDSLIVAIADNRDKEPLFTTDERIELIKSSIEGLDSITVTSFDGLTAKFAKDSGAMAIVRGLRAISDFEFEFQMALMNRKIEPDIEAVYLMPTDKFSYISSSLVKDIAKHGGDISCFVPKEVKEALLKKFSS